LPTGVLMTDFLDVNQLLKTSIRSLDLVRKYLL